MIMKILPEMYLWAIKSPLNFGSHVFFKKISALTLAVT